MPPLPLVIQTEHLAPQAAAWLAERCRVERCRRDEPRFDTISAEAQGLVIRTYTAVDEALLARCPSLRVVGRAGVGLDHVDIGACRARGVEVVYTPDANTQAVVEYVICQVAPLLRPAVIVRDAMTSEEWRWVRSRRIERPQMSAMTLGILGLGRIGRRLAQVGSAIGFKRVLYHDIADVEPAPGAESVPVEHLFAEADLLSIHVDGRVSNRGFVSGYLLATMRPEVIFVNTSRGFVVDHEALARFLQRNPGAVAVLDVHDPEPFGSDYPLLGVPNARLLPHMAAATTQADMAMSWVVRDVAAVLEGRAPEFPAP